MTARDQRNLLLEYRSERDVNVNVVLANIPGHSYTFGTLNPGEGEGEKFLLCRGFEGGIVGPTHCTIRVDDQGQYWIQDYTINPYEKRTFSFYETFVNSERVEASESRLLKNGDMISLGAPGTDWAGDGLAPHPIFRVKEGMIGTGSAGPQIDGKENEDGDRPKYNPEESPLDNGLILSKIMSYLPLPDLKNARLASKMWNGEASLLLEKRAKVSFDFGLCHYGYAQDSTKVDRYIHDMEGLKIQNLHISISLYRCSTERSPHLSIVEVVEDSNPLSLSSEESLDKRMSDLRKLLTSSHNFSSLSFQCCVFEGSDLLPLILQGLGGKLVELKFRGELPFFPKDLPPLPTMSNLRKFTQDGFLGSDSRQKWVSFLVPLFTESLEHFNCPAYSAGRAYIYLQEFLKHDMPKLRGIEIGDEITDNTLCSLLQLKTPLTLLKIHYCYKKHRSDEDSTLLEKLLFKNSQSLKHLTIEINHEYLAYFNFIIEFKFPPFPKLEELKLGYQTPSWMKITWETGDLDYKEHFPSLRKLTVVNWLRSSDYLDENDPVFDSFFPEVRCEGVKEVRVLEVKTHPRLDRIKETFPNAVLCFADGEDWCYSYERKCDDENDKLYWY